MGVVDKDWTLVFPALSALEPQARAALLAGARELVLAPGARAFSVGSACQGYVLVASGRIRVQQLAESGREIVLYRVGAGDTCVLTTACLLAGESYTAEAVAETEVHAYLVPKHLFDRLVATSPPFREFVFTAYATRLTALMLLVEEVAFQRMDVRLAQRLLERAEGGTAVALTHRELAVELGTAREVVSRQLKEFERRGWVALERGCTVIREPASLAALASGAPAHA